MRCTVIAPGSRGDVQPMMVLAGGLKRAGYEVRFATHRDFETAVRESGFEFFPISGQSANFFGGAGGYATRDRARDRGGKHTDFFERYLSPFVRKVLQDVWNSCQGGDFIVAWPWVRCIASLAEKLRVPVIAASTCPVPYLPTMAFPNPYQGPPYARFGPLYNRWSWRWARPMLNVGQAEVDHWRANVLGLPPRSCSDELRALRRLPLLLSYSPSILPRPIDWPSTVHVTGWWLAEEGAWQPPAELEAFLAAGKTPIGIGFSSQTSRNSHDLTAAFAEALERTDNRAVLATGVGGLGGATATERLFPIATAPYSWLLPRLTAMIHHGGSGSTGDTLHAGIPGVTVPFGYDQFLWADRLTSIGAAPPPLPVERITAEALADAIRRVTGDEAMRRRAAALGERVRAEDGIGNALRLIERFVEPARRTRSLPGTAQALRRAPTRS